MAWNELESWICGSGKPYVTVKTNVTWTIENFRNCREKYQEKITSSSFSVTDSDNRETKWCFYVFHFPKERQEGLGEDKTDYKDYIGVYLESMNEFPVVASLSCCVLDKNAMEI